MSLNREIQVVIVGGGLAGLSMAAFFRRADVQPLIIESADEFDECGVVELWPEAISLLDQLGIAGTIRDTGTVITEWTRRRPDGTVLTRLDTEQPGGLVAIPYERLREQFVSHLGPESIRMDTTLQSINTSDQPVAVTFENGVRERFDLVVGADGVDSRTREALDGATAISCGTTSLTFSLPGELELSGASEIWTPEGTVFRALPAGDRPMGAVTVPGEPPESGERPESALRNAARHIEWMLPEAVEAVRSGDVRSAEDRRPPADIWTQGRVALAGDAAHARHRLTGMGPTLAIEDAAVLVSELLDREDSLSARLAEYAARRRARVRRLQSPADGTTGPHPLQTVALPSMTHPSRVPEIRGAQLAAAFGSGSAPSRVRVSLSRTD